MSDLAPDSTRCAHTLQGDAGGCSQCSDAPVTRVSLRGPAMRARNDEQLANETRRFNRSRPRSKLAPAPEVVDAEPIDTDGSYDPPSEQTEQVDDTPAYLVARELPASLRDIDPYWLAAELAARGYIKKALVRLPVIEPEGPRPATRADCVDGPRPCPWTRCKFHLWRVDEIDRAGRRHHGQRDDGEGERQHLPHAEIRPWSPTTCALDVAETEDGASRSHVAFVLGITPERVAQLEDATTPKIERWLPDGEDEAIAALYAARKGKRT